VARSFETTIDYGQYDCSLEELTSRNKQILFWFCVGVFWLWLFIEIFDVLWFWEEFYLSISESGWQVVTENSDGSPSCEITEYDTCERLVGTGGVWWSLLGSLLTGIAMGPLVFSALIFSYRTKDVTRNWKEEIWGCLFLINPSIIWGLLWMVCLPYTWTLLPWGDWSTNWWKIFPFFFGLIWIGLVPAFFTIFGFISLFFNQKYNFDEQKEQESQEQSDDTSTADKVSNSDSSKVEVWMKKASIKEEKLHGIVIDHPKLGTTQITTSKIKSQELQENVHRIETKNTIYMIHEDDLHSSLEQKKTIAAKELQEAAKKRGISAENFWDSV